MNLFSARRSNDLRHTRVMDFRRERAFDFPLPEEHTGTPRTASEALPLSVPLVRPPGNDPVAVAEYLEDREKRCKAIGPKIRDLLTSHGFLAGLSDPFVRLLPIASCWDEQPFWPEIQHCEVIAALVGEDVVKTWSERGCLHGALSLIASGVRDEFRAKDSEQAYNTLVFSYAAFNFTAPPEQRYNKLIAIDPDRLGQRREKYSMRGNDCLLQEVNDLLVKLNHDAQALRDILLLGGVSPAISERLIKGISVVKLEFSTSENGGARNDALVQLSGTLFIGSTIASLVLLVSAYLSQSGAVGVILSFLAMVAGVVMLLSGEMAEEAWPDDDELSANAD